MTVKTWPSDCAVVESPANWMAHPAESRALPTPAPKVLAKNATLVRNAAGEKQVFSIGSDGMVWRTTFDLTSDAGYVQTCLGLPADSMAVALDRFGRMVVFAAYGLNLRCIVIESEANGGKWGRPELIELPEVENAIRLGAVYIQTVGDELFVGAFTQYAVHGTGKLYAFCYGQWGKNGVVLESTPVRMTSMRQIDMGDLRHLPMGGMTGFGDSSRHEVISSFW